jgi:hypothetical protein
MIETLKGFAPDTIAVKGSGFVSAMDYDRVLLPAVEQVLNDYDHARVYYEIAPDFAGISLGAIWRDFWVGIRHLTRWKRIAVVTDIPWIKRTVQMFGFVLPGATKVFRISEAAEARGWLDKER